MGNWVNRQSKNNNRSRSSTQRSSISRPGRYHNNKIVLFELLALNLSLSLIYVTGIKVRNVSICREREIVETFCRKHSIDLQGT